MPTPGLIYPDACDVLYCRIYQIPTSNEGNDVCAEPSTLNIGNDRGYVGNPPFSHPSNFVLSKYNPQSCEMTRRLVVYLFNTSAMWRQSVDRWNAVCLSLLWVFLASSFFKLVEQWFDRSVKSGDGEVETHATQTSGGSTKMAPIISSETIFLPFFLLNHIKIGAATKTCIDNYNFLKKHT